MSQPPCDHCGLPVPHSMERESNAGEPLFCCHGCRTVYAILHEHGLEDFYALRRAEDAPGVRAPQTGRGFEEFDDPQFLELYGIERGGIRSVPLFIEGMHCGACVWLLERLPHVMPGIRDVRIDFGRSRMHVEFDPDRVTLSEIARWIEAVGYLPHPYRGDGPERIRRRENRKFLIRIGVAGACAGNVMLIAFTLYGGDVDGMDDGFRQFFRWVSLFITLPVLWAGSTFFRGAWGGLRARTLSMDLPIAIGLGTGVLWSAINTIRGAGEIYFDSVASLVFLLLAGRWLQRSQQQRAGTASELLHSLSPRRARRVETGGIRTVPVEALHAGDTVQVLPGELVPADGTIESGASTLDRSLLTGESRAVRVEPGANVHAGVMNIEAPIQLSVREVGETTRIGQLLQLVEDHASRRPPIVQLADRISVYFVAAVLVLAAVTLAVWLPRDPAHAFDHMLALLVITCPCALGLATPLAITAAIGRAARSGLLVKGGDVLEALSRGGTLWLDKTGTLTEGKFSLVEWSGDDAILDEVARLERYSTHPVARAWVRSVRAMRSATQYDRHFEHRDMNRGFEERDESTGVEAIRQIAGHGIEGNVHGHRYVVGSAELARRTLGTLLDFWEEEIKTLATRGLTPVVVIRDGRIAGVAGFGDRPRIGVESLLDRLRSRNWKIGILSGDHSGVTDRLGRALGIDPERCIGACTPEQKLQIVSKSAAEENTVMVGDGVNDAAALAAATVGVSVHGGAEAALTAADVALTRGGLDGLADLIDGAARTRTVVRRNLAFSLGYNAIGATLAVLGLVHPLVAAILMPLSSFTVIVHSFRARTFTGTLPTSDNSSSERGSSDLSIHDSPPNDGASRKTARSVKVSLRGSAHTPDAASAVERIHRVDPVRDASLSAGPTPDREAFDGETLGDDHL